MKFHAQSPVFIVGVGRSGTSLVQSILASHSELAFPRETSFFRRFVVNRKLQQVYEKQGIESVKKILLNDRYLRRVELDVDLLMDGLTAYECKNIDAALYERILSCTARQEGKARYGDKDPNVIEYIHDLVSLWPRAKILHVVRDPRDVLASKKMAKWSRNRPSFLHIFANRIQWNAGRRSGLCLSSDNYYELVYENLLKSPHEELISLCNWLDIDYESNMMNFSDAAKKLVSDEERSWKEETMGPLLQDNCGKWVSQLKPWEIALTELACADMMRTYDYPKSQHLRTISLAVRLACHLSNIAMRVGEGLYIRLGVFRHG